MEMVWLRDNYMYTQHTLIVIVIHMNTIVKERDMLGYNA